MENSGYTMDISSDSAAQAERLALTVAQRLRDAIALRGAASLIVSGGNSPLAFFAALSEKALDWDRVSVGLADERWVDDTSADSNARLVKSRLLRGPAASAQFVPLKTAHASPDAALADRLTAVLNMPHPFDVVVLGMGDDGHTASLFPGAPDLGEALDPDATPALVAAYPPAAPSPRISLNLAALLQSRQIAILISGPAKRALLEKAGAASPLQWPIAAVLRQQRVPVSVYWAP